MKIAVFMGGSSPEREISLSSGAEIAKALTENGHDVTSCDVEWRGKNTLFPAVEECTRSGVDVVFLGLHGGLGEDGGIQGVLEAAGLTYTGSGITASGIAMDKDLSKQLFQYNDIPTAQWIKGSRDTIEAKLPSSGISYPFIVKPTDTGSTIGLTFVEDESVLSKALDVAGQYSPNIMIEAYISGTELTVPILGDKALPVIEIRPSHQIYDYECKYTTGMTEYFVPAPISQDLADEVSSTALKVFELLGLRDIARVDFRLDAGGKPLCFEANTLPGMTGTSLVPKSAKSAGIDFPELVSRIAELATNRQEL